MDGADVDPDDVSNPRPVQFMFRQEPLEVLGRAWGGGGGGGDSGATGRFKAAADAYRFGATGGGADPVEEVA